MEPQQRRKVKFAPKAPTRRDLKTTLLKQELRNEDELGLGAALEAQALLRQFNENLSRRGPKAKKKTQVAFGAGPTSSSSIRSIGVARKEAGTIKTNKRSVRSFDDDNEPVAEGFPSDAAENFGSRENALALSTERPEKIYREHWDYKHSYYPTILPLRPPNSGDPEILNAAEFGATVKAYDEYSTNAASNLGLMDENEDGKMLLFQLPSRLPMVKRPACLKAKEKVGASSSSGIPRCQIKRGEFEGLPAGPVGKILVYKSGVVKWKIGDIIYDVSPGSDVVCAQDVMAINPAKKQCCALGELGKRAVVVPDIDHLLNSVIDWGEKHSID